MPGPPAAIPKSEFDTPTIARDIPIKVNARGSFTRNTGIAFGHGCHHSCQVACFYLFLMPRATRFSPGSCNISLVSNLIYRPVFPEFTKNIAATMMAAKSSAIGMAQSIALTFFFCCHSARSGNRSFPKKGNSIFACYTCQASGVKSNSWNVH